MKISWELVSFWYDVILFEVWYYLIDLELLIAPFV